MRGASDIQLLKYMTFKQIGLIDNKYIYLVILFLKYIVYYINLTCFIIYDQQVRVTLT